MIPDDAYIDLRGDSITLSSLDDEERQLVVEVKHYAKNHPDARTAEFENYWFRRVGDFYLDRGLARRDITRTAVWRIAQDLNSRLMIAAGMAKRGDYRNELESLILKKYKTRRAFCEATGLSEDMLSHVLAKRKHLAIETLSDALAKIGYTIHITQMPDISISPSPHSM